MQEQHWILMRENDCDQRFTDDLQMPVTRMDCCMSVKRRCDSIVTHKDLLKAIFYDLPAWPYYAPHEWIVHSSRSTSFIALNNSQRCSYRKFQAPTELTRSRTVNYGHPAAENHIQIMNQLRQPINQIHKNLPKGSTA